MVSLENWGGGLKIFYVYMYINIYIHMFRAKLVVEKGNRNQIHTNILVLSNH